jgi:hypothetical protein
MGRLMARLLLRTLDGDGDGDGAGGALDGTPAGMVLPTTLVRRASA